MPLSSQFSLSLELTRLVPLALTAAGKTYDSAMSLARSLQSSGSDIVVEEDLLELFGRSRIAPQIESRFRRTVSTTGPPQQLCEGIALYDGPGPTVNRALAGERVYFSTVIQCSFLVNMYDKNSLAAALAYHLEKQMEGATDQLLRAVPSQEIIRGALRACEDQTSSFGWRDVITPIGMTLELPENKMCDPIPSAVFRGLVSMMPLVQHFPEDRLIYIETPSGVCNIVAWAHIILGLSVVVHVERGADSKEYRFGTPSEQVIISCPQAVVPSITLMSADTKESLFKIVQEPDEDEIDATAKISARGYATRAFDKLVPTESGRENVIMEMAFITTAFAICVSRCLHYARPVKTQEALEGRERKFIKYNPSESAIYEAASLLFDINKLNRKKLEDYVSLYTNRSLYLQEPTPRPITLLVQDWNAKDEVWPYLCFAASQLCILILAFAHVINLAGCEAFEMCEHHGLLARSELSIDLATWDGKSPLQIREDVWFEAIALLLVGHTVDSDFSEVSLLSNWGWSIYVSTFANSDPSYIRPGYVAIQKGVPCRNGVWKHKIVDGRGTMRFGNILPVTRLGTEIIGMSGDTVPLSCVIPAEFAPPLIGERGDSFVVSLRLNSGQDVTTRDRTGYNELAAAIRTVQKTRPCRHGSGCRLRDNVVLEPGCTAVSSISVTADLTQYGSVIIFLTAGVAAARWRALLSIAQHTSDEDYGFTPVILRGPDCCFRCSLDQALERVGVGVWCVVL